MQRLIEDMERAKARKNNRFFWSMFAVVTIAYGTFIFSRLTSLTSATEEDDAPLIVHEVNLEHGLRSTEAADLLSEEDYEALAEQSDQRLREKYRKKMSQSYSPKRSPRAYWHDRSQDFAETRRELAKRPAKKGSMLEQQKFRMERIQDDLSR